MTTTRRDFLLGGASVGAALPLVSGDLAPDWLLAAGANAAGAADVLVVVQVRGGWDWLNILVRPDDKTYQAARPTIGLHSAATRAKLVPVKGHPGYFFHPGMVPAAGVPGAGGIRDLFERGDAALIRNIGYPNPNLSHFTSEKKWAAADPTVHTTAQGWLSKWLNNRQGGFQIPALLVGANVTAFNGSRVPKMTSPTSLSLEFDPRTGRDSGLEKLAVLVNAMVPRTDATARDVADALRSAIQDSDLLRIAGNNYRPKVSYPDSTLARYLQLVARYITAGMPTNVYYLNTGGYDTHRGQSLQNDPLGGRLKALLARDFAAVKAFLDDVKAHGKGSRVVVMMFSEFGRRIGENGSIGTDHGHGGLALLLGEPVVGGLYGKYPDLSIYSAPYSRQWIRFNQDSTDFRQMYATVLDKVLGVPHERVLGRKFSLLGAL